MRRLLLLALVVLGCAGCSFWNSSWRLSLPTAQEGLTSEIAQLIPRWVKDENLPDEALLGAKLFATAGCTACHTYDGSGGSNLGAPDLTAEGAKNRGIDFQIRHLKCPSCVHSGSPMPRFESLGEEQLRQLAIFLEASRGTH